MNLSVKPIIYAVGLTLALIVGGCNPDNLNVAPGSPTEDSYFKSELDFEALVRGIYAKQSELYGYRAGNYVHAVRHLPGDDITTTGSNPLETFASLQPAVGTPSNYYATLYRIIYRANTALDKISGVADGVYLTAGLKNRHRGEALFMRGLSYFWLANTFGTSPLRTERLESLEDVAAPSVADGQLLDQAITDFTEAASLLPETWDAANAGRATSNAANGMLGKCLVFRATINKTTADYSAAISAFAKIKNRSLVADFADNFAADRENNVESLFEFQASRPPSTDNTSLPDDFEPGGVGSTSGYWGFYEPNNSLLFGTARFIATKKLLAAFDPADPRREVTLNPANRDIRKYWTRDQKTSNPGASANNARILRLADVLLLQAEAIVQSGGSMADAVALVNQVRTRARNMKTGGTVPANLPTTLTVVEAMDAIRNERFVELAGEESHRWFDLRRWHKGGQINLASGFDFSSDQPTQFGFDVNKNLLFPIPLSETDNNPNVKQNPGY
ncbi:RagB/SusD family nutrient uptake outer membrane protein [Spirosoma endophyticum]|uniref:Starch-binding associating with outer membrane n=1 Tax=Spirosoma endophyticum TaxID=662367 RepID=A0A1I1W748_9BACT|nr:RagB/SusD family nutrient uptake outer membrane protein [Spirosoma endophyticum]SFD90967.1 Starch-binding associating with outer membrane [Spirosoma endophyticum]